MDTTHPAILKARDLFARSKSRSDHRGNHWKIHPEIVIRLWLELDNQHLDENPKNNDPKNLFLFDSASAHLSFHQRLLGCQRKGIEVDATQLVLENGGRALPSPPAPLLFVPGKVPPDRIRKKRKKCKVRKAISRPVAFSCRQLEFLPL